jgi:hypothetical protein
MLSVRPISRRLFLKQLSVLGGAALVTLSLPPRLRAFGQPASDKFGRPFYMTRGGEIMLDKLTHDVFSEHVGSTFRIQLEDGGSVDLDLNEATRLGSQSDSGSTATRDPFSLVFKGPKDAELPQQTYDVDHGVIGSFALFLVPIGADDTGTFYEAVFN